MRDEYEILFYLFLQKQPCEMCVSAFHGFLLLKSINYYIHLCGGNYQQPVVIKQNIIQPVFLFIKFGMLSFIIGPGVHFAEFLILVLLGKDHCIHFIINSLMVYSSYLAGICCVIGCRFGIGELENREPEFFFLIYKGFEKQML